MKSYTVTVTVDSTADDADTTGRILDGLAGLSAAIGWGDDGRMDVTITVDAIDLAAAASQSITAVTDAARAAAVRAEAMTTVEFDHRNEQPLVG